MGQSRNIDLIAGVITDKFDAWNDAQDTRRSNWNRFKRIAQLNESGDDKSSSKTASEISTIKMPTTKNAVTMAVDNLYSILFPQRKFFEIKGRTFGDDRAAEILTEYLLFLTDKDNSPSKIKSLIYDLCVYGTGVLRINAATSIEKSIIPEGRRRKKNNGKIVSRFLDLFAAKSKGKRIVLEEVERITPEIEWISIFDFFIEPQAVDIASSSGVIIRKIQKKRVLSAMEAVGSIKGVSLLDNRLEGDVIQPDTDRQRHLHDSGTNLVLEPDDVEIFEYWGWLDKDTLRTAGYQEEIKHGGAEVVAIIANRSIVLSLKPNPFLTQARPFVSQTFEDKPGEFYGLGIVEAAIGAQQALDKTIRSRLDNKDIAINQVFGVDLNRLSVDDDGNIYPGKTFFTEGNPRDVIQQLPIADVTAGSYIEAQEFERYIHEATGVSPILAGLTGGRSKTATESTLQQRNSSTRLGMVALGIERNVITPILRWFYQITMQFIDDAHILKITRKELFANPEEVTLTPESILGDWNFIPTGLRELNLQRQLPNLLQFLSLTANPLDIQVTNRAFLLREVAKRMNLGSEELIFRNNTENGRRMVQNAQGVKGVGGVASADNGDVSLPEAQTRGGIA